MAEFAAGLPKTVYRSAPVQRPRRRKKPKPA
jgi:hypothetical protein